MGTCQSCCNHGPATSTERHPSDCAIPGPSQFEFEPEVKKEEQLQPAESSKLKKRGFPSLALELENAEEEKCPTIEPSPSTPSALRPFEESEKKKGVDVLFTANGFDLLGVPSTADDSEILEEPPEQKSKINQLPSRQSQCSDAPRITLDDKIFHIESKDPESEQDNQNAEPTTSPAKVLEPKALVTLNSAHEIESKEPESEQDNQNAEPTLSSSKVSEEKALAPLNPGLCDTAPSTYSRIRRSQENQLEEGNFADDQRKSDSSPRAGKRSVQSQASYTVSRQRNRSVTNDVCWGLPDHLTEEQMEALHKVKSLITREILEEVKFAVESEENALCRFLRARKFNVDDTVKMILNCRSRRLEDHVSECIRDGAEKCLGCPVEVYKTFYPEYYIGFDKHRRVLMIQQAGRLNTTALDCLTSHDRILRYHWYNLEARNALFAQAKDIFGSPNIAIFCIMDLAGTTIQTINNEVFQFLKVTSKLGQDCYPELMGKMYIINAPTFFVGVWKAIKNMLDPRTVSKIEIVGSVPTAKLLQAVDADVLPEEYGGKAKGKLQPHSSAVCQYLFLGATHTEEVLFGENTNQQLVIRTFTSSSDIRYTVMYQPTSATANAIAQELVSRTIDISSNGREMIENTYTEPGKYTVRWRNCSKLKAKHFVYHIFFKVS